MYLHFVLMIKRSEMYLQKTISLKWKY